MSPYQYLSVVLGILAVRTDTDHRNSRTHYRT
ncbi:hypothetical protein P3X46_004677 [Hevea brasiliensis]|uniref:Uncharacterized protein n=1 Tax=Hevea brasiliensis TaxID=3981 RepID=A0ABQ9MXH8_HEVBR|nr:hypothetical protein P3X46_004677 [Hevea brasiliensis]